MINEYIVNLCETKKFNLFQRKYIHLLYFPTNQNLLKIENLICGMFNATCR